VKEEGGESHFPAFFNGLLSVGRYSVIMGQMTEKQFRNAIVAKAASDLGQGEEGGNNMGPFVEKQMLGTGQPLQGEGAPWCTAWATRVINDAASGAVKHTASTRDIAGQFRNAGALKKIAPDASNVHPGDVIIMPRTDGDKIGAHSAIVESVADGRINTIQGNINPDGTNADHTDVLQGVHRKSYSISELRNLTKVSGLGVGNSVALANRNGKQITLDPASLIANADIPKMNLPYREEVEQGLKAAPVLAKQKTELSASK
jgi:CHAP domain